MPNKKVSGFWSQVGLNIGAVMRPFFFSFLPISEIRDTCIPGYWSHTKFTIHKVAKRGLTNRANVVKKSFKLNTAEFQSIQQFWLQLDIVS